MLKTYQLFIAIDVTYYTLCFEHLIQWVIYELWNNKKRKLKLHTWENLSYWKFFANGLMCFLIVHLIVQAIRADSYWN